MRNFFDIHAVRAIGAMRYFQWMLLLALGGNNVARFGAVLVIVGLITIVTPAPLVVWLVTTLVGAVILVYQTLPPRRRSTHRYYAK